MTRKKQDCWSTLVRKEENHLITSRMSLFNHQTQRKRKAKSRKVVTEIKTKILMEFRIE
jgi:hypothetical protein